MSVVKDICAILAVLITVGFAGLAIWALLLTVGWPVLIAPTIVVIICVGLERIAAYSYGTATPFWRKWFPKK